MPESFIPVWMSLGEAENMKRNIEDDADNSGEYDERSYDLVTEALEKERPRSADEMEVERKGSADMARVTFKALDRVKKLRNAIEWAINNVAYAAPEVMNEKVAESVEHLKKVHEEDGVTS